jgi:hypothetical protein
MSCKKSGYFSITKMKNNADISQERGGKQLGRKEQAVLPTPNQFFRLE